MPSHTDTDLPVASDNGADADRNAASVAAAPAASPDPAATRSDVLDRELAGLDALELVGERRRSWPARIWAASWPKLTAAAIGLAIWQVVVWSGWKPESLLPGPQAVFSELWSRIQDGTLTEATARTMGLAVRGYLLSVVIGTVLGALVARNRILRSAVGSLISGIQTMPSVAWVPWAILLFGLSDGAIFFVIVLGTVPAVANGLIMGTDQIPPIVLRAGRVLGARGWRGVRYVLLPASLPGFVAGLKQGWAFAWRSLMAGEIIVTVAGEPKLGFLLQNSRTLRDSAGVMAIMLVILFIGILVDAVVFASLERFVARRWGLSGPVR
jgi:NitT/TauT family transport system permease protein